jgi:phage terminase small subunit
MEVKRATGRTPGHDSGGRALKDISVVHVLPMANEKPKTPEMLGPEGIKLWDRVWDNAISWLSPKSDMDAIENACRLADAVTSARTKYMATLEGADARAYVSLNDAFTKSLASLGFDPVSRSRLGVAEVQRVSALDQLLAKRQKRQ